MSSREYLCNNDTDVSQFRTKPGWTRAGKPVDWMVQERLRSGEWHLECIQADVLGTARPLEVFRAPRKTSIIKPWQNLAKDDASYCPAHWADLAIGSGACGARCRACFSNLTHRIQRDPSRHLLYDNLDDYERATRKWLQKPTRRNLGLGIDCSDSMLYEGVTGHVRRLAPLFSNMATNPCGCKLILLTKSTNVHYLQGLSPRNILLTFSLNPELIADLWEGKWPDGLRITPSVEARLAASRMGQEMGFEVRWRVDPILPVKNWREIYRAFFEHAAADEHRPTRVTLGTYREMSRSLLTWGEMWGLPPVEWLPPELEKDGSHWHIPHTQRVGIYRELQAMIENAWKDTGHSPIVALCKETQAVRNEVGISHDRCNCG